MYRLRYPAVSGGETGVEGASGATTGMSFIVRDGLARRQGGVGIWILMRHWEERMSSSQRGNQREEKTMAGWREEQPKSGVVRGLMARRVNSEQKKAGKRKE